MMKTHPQTWTRRTPATPWTLRSLAAGLVALAAATSGCATEEEPRSLTIVSFGGSYGRASAKAWFEPFEASTGIQVDVVDYNGGLAQIRAQVEAGHVFWDVVDMDLADAVAGCDEGLLEEIDKAALAPAPDGTPAVDDYPEASITECGVGNLRYATVVAFNTEKFPGEKPSTLSDYFDLEKFPGRRGMRRFAQENLEFALMADGVAASEVYATLDTPEGVERAFRKLDTIKEDVVWWETGAQPPQMLADGEVLMSTAWNGRIFNAQILEQQPFEIIWDGHVAGIGQHGIVAGTPNLEAAIDYVVFASSPERQAAISRYISYSPLRFSAYQFVSTHEETGIDIRPHLPPPPSDSINALFTDWQWWSDNADEMNERFSSWLAR